MVINLRLTKLTEHNQTMTYDVGYPGLGFEQE